MTGLGPKLNSVEPMVGTQTTVTTPLLSDATGEIQLASPVARSLVV